MAKIKRTNNNLQNITHKTKNRVTGTPRKTGGGTIANIVYIITKTLESFERLILLILPNSTFTFWNRRHEAV